MTTVRSKKEITKPGLSNNLSKNLAYLPVKPSKVFGSPFSSRAEFWSVLKFLLPKLPKIEPIAGVKAKA